MASSQPGILALLPAHARFLTFRLVDGADAVAVRTALVALAARELPTGAIVGIGEPSVGALGATLEGLRAFPALTHAAVAVPSTQHALWIRLAAGDRGANYLAGHAIVEALAPAFALVEAVDGYQHDGGRDLTGYEDGTENPTGDDAVDAAIVAGRGDGLDGGSFVAVQRWIHDFARFGALSPDERDASIGRRREDNEELADAPPSAHVKRTAQESFTPEAFVLRRSMPWHGEEGAGLYFVAFGATLDAFEAQLRRMVGLEDGVADALFRFTRPVTGSYFFCPPFHEGRLDLRALGVA